MVEVGVHSSPRNFMELQMMSPVCPEATPGHRKKRGSIRISRTTLDLTPLIWAMGAGRVVLACVGWGHADVPENTTPALGVFIEGESGSSASQRRSDSQEVHLHLG